MKTNAEWKYWGRADPLWAVASFEGKEAGSQSAWTAAEFLALGASDFADALRHWRHYGLKSGRCLEIGCGAGRMTKQLAETFDAVLAIDVSQDQIARARELLGPSAARVEFQVVDEPTIAAPSESCDAMFSCHVFQHLPTGAVAQYLRETYRLLRPGASICFHVPVPGAHLTTRRSALTLWTRNLYLGIKRALGIVRIAEYHRYPATRVFALLAGLGFTDLELRIFAMTSNGDYHSYFLARKPTAASR